MLPSWAAEVSRFPGSVGARELYPTLKRWASLKSPFGTGSLQRLSLVQLMGKMSELQARAGRQCRYLEAPWRLDRQFSFPRGDLPALRRGGPFNHHRFPMPCHRRTDVPGNPIEAVAVLERAGLGCLEDQVLLIVRGHVSV